MLLQGVSALPSPRTWAGETATARNSALGAAQFRFIYVRLPSCPLPTGSPAGRWLEQNPTTPAPLGPPTRLLEPAVTAAEDAKSTVRPLASAASVAVETYIV